MPEDDLPPEARAVSLLPPDPPAAPERRVAERRVAGWRTTVRLANRVARRPAGNSRRFWSKVEGDDPFLPPPSGARLTDESHAMYPLDRAGRVESAPATRQEATRPWVDPPAPKARPPQPPVKSNEPVHTPDPRAVRAPPPPARPVAPQPPPPEPEAPPILDRRLPKMPPPPRPQPGSWTARNQPQPAAQRPSAPGPAQSRQPPKDAKVPPKGMSLDRALSILGELKDAEDAAKRGEKYDEPPPAPRAVAPSPQRVAPPQPAPRPPSERPAPPQSRPLPPPSRPAPPPSRSNASPDGEEDGPLPPPPRVSTQGKLDDLFGGAGQQEGRVRIGAVKKKTLE